MAHHNTSFKRRPSLPFDSEMADLLEISKQEYINLLLLYGANYRGPHLSFFNDKKVLQYLQII